MNLFLLAIFSLLVILVLLLLLLVSVTLIGVHSSAYGIVKRIIISGKRIFNQQMKIKLNHK